MTKSGQLVRGKNGQFIKGESGNPSGRPKGSKNVITLQKLILEEKFRGANERKLELILDAVLDKALDGDKSSQKLVWDSVMSKQQIAEEKNAGARQSIVVHTMNVGKDEAPIIEGVIIDEEETIQ